MSVRWSSLQLPLGQRTEKVSSFPLRLDSIEDNVRPVLRNRCERVLGF